MLLLVFILLIILLDIVSLRYGVDSRRTINAPHKEDFAHSWSCVPNN